MRPIGCVEEARREDVLEKLEPEFPGRKIAQSSPQAGFKKGEVGLP